MKKVLSIVLSLVMVLCMMPVMAFAGTNDVAYNDIAGEKCEGAVNVLSALGVVDGYEDGSYKPNKVVTRAEMAKLIVTALGVADYASATTSKYSDMAAAKWAIPYVEYASNLGIIEGVGNGRFSPNNPVTYEQAVTMIVRALGYTTDCNEMNGTWPAVYVQKATALGIFKNVEGNKYGTGADRGDVAIMLYNAIDLPEVYADKDGATHYKNGSEQFTINGAIVNGVSMLSTLNKDGDFEYKIVDESDADKALTNMRSYVGIAGKVVTNKNGDVLAVSDTETTLLTGSFDKDGKKFTVGDTTYSVGSKALTEYDNNKSPKSKEADAVKKFVNGAESGTISAENLKDKTCTICAKINGKTITQIWSVAEWNAKSQALFTDADAVTIANKSKIGNYTFLENVDGDIDYTKFVLEGVDSLDKIAKDNVVYVYADAGNSIRKVSVGTKVVEGTWEGLKDTGTTNKTAKLTVDGTVYEAYNKVRFANSDINVDSAELGDKVKLYLDNDGKVFRMKQVEANTIYGLVLDKAAGNETAGISGKAHKIRIMTSEGEYKTYELARGNAYKGTAFASLDYGDVIKYAVNADGLIVNAEVYVDQSASAVTKDVSAAGYYDGNMITDSTVVFVLPETSVGTNIDALIKDDQAKTSNKAGLLNTQDVKSVYTAKDGVIKAMVIGDENISGTDLYGVRIGAVKTNDTNYPWTITMLVDGKEVTYQAADNYGSSTARQLFKITLNASGKLTALTPSTSDVLIANTFQTGDTLSITDNGYIKLGAVVQGAFDANAIFYVYSDTDGYEVGTKADILTAKDGTNVSLIDTDVTASNAGDGVADIVIINGPALTK